MNEDMATNNTTMSRTIPVRPNGSQLMDSLISTLVE
jgi:hypothetical protein